MSWEELGALSTFFTLIVIAASAIAAVIQLRHMSSSNQLSATLGLMERWATPEFRELSNYVFRGELDRRLADPHYREDLMSDHTDQIAHPEIAYLGLWETIGSIVKMRYISEEAFLDQAGLICIASWDKLAPVIAIMRRNGDLRQFDNFEYLASRAKLWEAAHPGSEFPKGTPRLPTPDPYPDDPRPQGG
ncbi:MAG: hypothetical protein JO347_01410 [Candidatus Eremiobacteraeota bacterium]|nr:hypothetical protein [Candidatus Eremiobacteraeota bacterium]